MTGLEPTQGRELLVLPHTGELLDPNQPEDVAYAIDSIRTHITRMHDLRAQLETVLQEEFLRQGTKTLHFETFTATLTGGTTIEWDTELLAEELRNAGLPDQRVNQVVVQTVTYKVNATEAKRAAAANPTYAAIIEASKTVVPAAWRVTVKHR